MIPPIDIACPHCEALAGHGCTDPMKPGIHVARVPYHHAARIDAAASTAESTCATRHQELSDAEVAAASVELLRLAYKTLREHHVVETTALIADRDGRAIAAIANARQMERDVRMIERMRSVYEAAIEWRRSVNLVPASPITARLIGVIDTAIAAETGDAK